MSFKLYFLFLRPLFIGGNTIYFILAFICPSISFPFLLFCFLFIFLFLREFLSCLLQYNLCLSFCYRFLPLSTSFLALLRNNINISYFSFLFSLFHFHYNSLWVSSTLFDVCKVSWFLSLLFCSTVLQVL